MLNTKLKILISGASTGIGHATAEALAQEGHTVFAGLRNKNVVFKSSNVTPLVLDVTSEESIKSALDEILHQTDKKLDVLMNNAGIAVGGPLESVGLNALKKQFEVNVFGLYELTRQTLPALRATHGSKIINISSVAGLFATPFMGPYCSSKFAVEALSDSWRRELGKFGIKVVLVEPGPIATPIWEKSITKTPDLEHSDTTKLYEPELSRFLDFVKTEAANAVPVSDLTDLLLKIVAKPNPKARYLINGRKSLLKIFSVLPEKWVDALIKKQFALRR
jgi:NAD(P)-dependent dehydrogenase (short-subunit alcohol dehydrogenase family)